MENLLSFFTRNSVLSTREGLEIYDFTGDSIAFVQDYVRRFREAYFCEEKLERSVAESKTATRKDTIEQRLPKLTKNKVGDFGEILSYHLCDRTKIECKDF